MISPRGHQSQGGANPLFDQFFLKTALNWRNFGPEAGPASLALLLGPPMHACICQIKPVFDKNVDKSNQPKTENSIISGD